MDGRLDGLYRLCMLYGLSILRVGVTLGSHGLCRPVRCRSGNRHRSWFGSRCNSGGNGESLPAEFVIQRGTRDAVIIYRGKLQKASRFLHQTLRGKKVRVLEVTIVQGRELVCLRRRVHSSTSFEIFIHVFYSGAEYGDLLDEGLECTGVSRIPGPVPRLVLGETFLIFCQFFDPDVDQPLQFSRSQVGEHGVLPEVERSGGSIADIRSFHQVRLELETFSELFRQARKLVRGGERAQNDKYLLPLLKVGVLDDVAQVVSDDRLEQPKIR